MPSRSPRNFEHRSRIGSFAHTSWATRARETISGSSETGVLAKCASTFPVAGLIEGSVSTGLAVAAISAILTDFEAARLMLNRRPPLTVVVENYSTNLPCSPVPKVPECVDA